MLEFENTIRINRPIAEVFAFLSHDPAIVGLIQAASA